MKSAADNVVKLLAAVTVLLVAAVGVLVALLFFRNPAQNSSIVALAPSTHPAFSVNARSAGVPRIIDPTASAVAQTKAQKAAADRADAKVKIAALSDQLAKGTASEKQQALDDLRHIAIVNPVYIGDNISLWVQPLLDDKQYDDVEKLARVAIIARGFDLPTVTLAQRSRVLAYMGQENYPQALIEAKGLYNVTALETTPDAINLVAAALEKTQGASAAARFRREQVDGARPAAEATPAATASNDFGGAPEMITDTPNTLKSIKIDPANYAETIIPMEGRAASIGASPSNLMERGNLLLLADRAGEARKCFVEALAAAGTSTKAVRDALSGVVRSERDRTDFAGDGNLMVANLRDQNLRTEIIGRESESQLSVVDEAASQLKTASTVYQLTPALETARQAYRAIGTDSDIQIVSASQCSPSFKVRQLSRSHFEITLDLSEQHDWFLFEIDGGKGEIVRVDIKDLPETIRNWTSLRPLISGATSLGDLDAYIPNALEVPATKLDSVGGIDSLPSTTNQRWHFISDVWFDSNNIYSMVVLLGDEHSSIAMRAPYTPDYNDHFFREVAKNSRVNVVEVGKTPQGRSLRLAEILSDKSDNLSSPTPTILMYAGEHADEPDAMWAVNGALRYAASGPLQKNCNFLFIPMLDPDGCALGIHEHIISTYLTQSKSTESTLYSNWFRQWIESGHRLDLVLNLHNVQAAESTSFACALSEGLGKRGDCSKLLNHQVIQFFKDRNVETTSGPWHVGWSPDRLGGWLSRRYGPLCLTYELNSQSPNRHLRISELGDLGAMLVEAIALHPDSELWQNIKNLSISQLRDREARKQAFQGNIPDNEDAIDQEAKFSNGVGVIGGRPMNGEGQSFEAWFQ